MIPMDKKATSVTGRDGYLICQALAYAIETIENLPPQWREWSNQQDMKTLLNHMTGNAPGMYIHNARANMQQRRYSSIDEMMQANIEGMKLTYVDEKRADEP